MEIPTLEVFGFAAGLTLILGFLGAQPKAENR